MILSPNSPGNEPMSLPVHTNGLVMINVSISSRSNLCDANPAAMKDLPLPDGPEQKIISFSIVSLMYFF